MMNKPAAVGLAHQLLLTTIVAGSLVATVKARLSAPRGMARLLEEDNGYRRLEHPGGAEFHRTANRVRDLRTVPVRGDSLQLYLWEEENLSTSTGSESFYAVGVDGNQRRGRVRSTTYIIRLRNFEFDPIVDGPPSVPEEQAARSDSRLYLMQLEVTLLPEMRQDIADLGVKIHRFIPDHTFIVEMSQSTLVSVEELNYTRWVGPYHPCYKAGYDLLPSSTTATQRYSIMTYERGDVIQQYLIDLVVELGGSVELVERGGGRRIEANLTEPQLLEITHSDLVQYVDLWGGPVQLDMNVVRENGGADYVETVEGFTGQGVRGEVFDSELLTNHLEWNHVPDIHSTFSSVDTCGGFIHGTMSYSNNFAQGIKPEARGVIPNGTGIFFCALESTQFGGLKSRYDANAELIDPNGSYRAVFQTSSVGSARTFFYTTLSAETDDYLFQHQLLSTQSQSNAGNQDSRPQAWAKNIVSVGGIRHLNTLDECDDFHGAGASTGPAQDGRIKPDLAFYYDSISSASGEGSSIYTQYSGTSSATPQTSGYFGLLFQMWHEGVWAGHGGGTDVFDSRPAMSTAKALMINSAKRYNWVDATCPANSDINRFVQGWGRPDIKKLYDRANVTEVIDESDVIAPQETKSYSVVVLAGETELLVTMVFTDPAGTPGASVNRINDLSLRVTSPTNVMYWGNYGLTTSNWSTSGGGSNTVDTVENVFVENPQSGTWTVEIFGDEIVQDAHVETGDIDAVFALVISGATLETSVPSMVPSEPPTSQPSSVPSKAPSEPPTSQPSSVPSMAPSEPPTSQPSSVPSMAPSEPPTSQPSSVPSTAPSEPPTSQPSSVPSMAPSEMPTSQPSSVPSTTPSAHPTSQPSSVPSTSPSAHPTSQPVLPHCVFRPKAKIKTTGGYYDDTCIRSGEAICRNDWMFGIDNNGLKLWYKFHEIEIDVASLGIKDFTRGANRLCINERADEVYLYVIYKNGVTWLKCPSDSDEELPQLKIVEEADDLTPYSYQQETVVKFREVSYRHLLEISNHGNIRFRNSVCEWVET